MDNDANMGGAVLAGMMIFAAAGCLFFLAVKGFVCWLLSGCLKRIPVEHRKQTPGMVWLLMIPLFDLFWNFMVFPKIAESFDSYFKAKGETVESPAKMAQILCILAACTIISFIPILGLIGYPIGLAAFVVLIIVLIKFNELKNRIPQQTA